MIKLKDILNEWGYVDPGPKRNFKPYGDKYTEWEKATNPDLKEDLVDQAFLDAKPVEERLKKGESGCCHKCGHSHRKGSAHVTPYRTGKNSCANRKKENVSEADLHSKLSRGHKPDWHQLHTPEFKPFDKSKDDVEEKFDSKAQQRFLYATNPDAAEKLGSKMRKKDWDSLPSKVKEGIVRKVLEKHPAMGSTDELVGVIKKLKKIWNKITSDVRLKENIQRIGTSKSGIPMYEFNYLGQSERYQGVMAQDLVDMKKDNAVYKDNKGFYSVDYSEIDVEFKQLEAAI